MCVSSALRLNYHGWIKIYTKMPIKMLVLTWWQILKKDIAGIYACSMLQLI